MTFIVLFACLAVLAALIFLNQGVTIEPFYSESQSQQSNYFPFYRKLDMSSGESPYKCRSCNYGSSYDYKAQNKERTYGVPNGCQQIF
jgi:hypothetical protein